MGVGRGQELRHHLLRTRTLAHDAVCPVDEVVVHAILERLDGFVGQLGRTAGVDVGGQEQGRDGAYQLLVLDRIDGADLEAVTDGEEATGIARCGLGDRIAFTSLDGLGALEREFFLAQVGEELAFDVVALGDHEAVEVGIVAAHDHVHRPRQATRAFWAVDGVEQIGGDIVGRICLAVLDDRLGQPGGQHFIEAPFDFRITGVAGRIGGANAEDLTHFTRHQHGQGAGGTCLGRPHRIEDDGAQVCRVVLHDGHGNARAVGDTIKVVRLDVQRCAQVADILDDGGAVILRQVDALGGKFAAAVLKLDNAFVAGHAGIGQGQSAAIEDGIRLFGAALVEENPVAIRRDRHGAGLQPLGQTGNQPAAGAAMQKDNRIGLLVLHRGANNDDRQGDGAAVVGAARLFDHHRAAFDLLRHAAIGGVASRLGIAGLAGAGLGCAAGDEGEGAERQYRKKT